jgi:hypothetical protein
MEPAVRTELVEQLEHRHGFASHRRAGAQFAASTRSAHELVPILEAERSTGAGWLT